MGLQIPRGEGAFWGLFGLHKSIEFPLQYTQQKINNGISATVVAECIAPDWLVPHLLFFHEKSAPCDAAWI